MSHYFILGGLILNLLQGLSCSLHSHIFDTPRRGDPSAELWVYLATTTKYCIDANPLHLQTGEHMWIYWCLRGQTSLLQVTINLLYHCSIESLGLLSSKAKE